MGRKYIVEIGRLERLYKAFVSAHGKPEITWLSPEVDLTPYTDPDLEQVRKEAYQKGYETGYEDGYNEPGKNQQEAYQRGLNDAWEAARKICLNDSDGGLTVTEIANIFDVSYYRDAMKKYSAQEAIEEIRAYEQAQKEKEEQIKIGDEVIIRNKTAVVTEITDRYVRIMYSDGNSYALFLKGMVKTGRHFPEIAEVLAKMKETNNG